MLDVLVTLLPVFLVIALGFGLRRFEAINSDTAKGMNWLTYWVGLPALVLVKIAEAPLNLSEAKEVVLLCTLATLVCTVAGYVLTLVFKVEWRRAGTMVQAGFRANMAFVALPVIVFAFMDRSHLVEPDRAETLVVLTLGPIMVLYNLLAVLVLVASGQRSVDRVMVRRIIWRIVTNPLILASVIGLVFALLGLKLPLVASRTLDVIGQFALPLALICVGCSLATTKLGGHLFEASLATFVKLVIGPVAGYGLAMWWGADHEQMLVAVMMLASPTAVASFVMAGQLDGDEGLASAAIVLSSILSPISFGVVLWTLM